MGFSSQSVRTGVRVGMIRGSMAWLEDPVWASSCAEGERPPQALRPNLRFSPAGPAACTSCCTLGQLMQQLFESRCPHDPATPWFSWCDVGTRSALANRGRTVGGLVSPWGRVWVVFLGEQSGEWITCHNVHSRRLLGVNQEAGSGLKRARRPHSVTSHRASTTMRRLILDWPCSRSRNEIGASPTDRPRFQAR
jgi:hypothetical protein